MNNLTAKHPLSAGDLPLSQKTAEDEKAIRAMKDVFVAGVLKKDARLRASTWTDDGTVAPPTGGFFAGRRAIENDFQKEAASVVETSKMTFSNFRFRFLTGDIALVDADLTINNGLDPHETTVPELHVSVVFSAVRRGGKWFVQDERAHFVPVSGAGASNGPLTARD